MNNPEALFLFLQISGIAFACAAGICMIIASILFFSSRKDHAQAPFASAPAQQYGYPAAGNPLPPQPPYTETPDQTEVLYGRGNRIQAGYDGQPFAVPFETFSGWNETERPVLRRNAKFEIVKENILIHSDEEIPLD